MSQETRQGRGRKSPTPQRSPEELAALLAEMADATGDPAPRHARASRLEGLPSAFAPPVVTPRTRVRPAPKASPPTAEPAPEAVDQRPRLVDRNPKPAPETPPAPVDWNPKP